jgi:hypothetical protein
LSAIASTPPCGFAKGTRFLRSAFSSAGNPLYVRSDKCTQCHQSGIRSIAVKSNTLREVLIDLIAVTVRFHLHPGVGVRAVQRDSSAAINGVKGTGCRRNEA